MWTRRWTRRWRVEEWQEAADEELPDIDGLPDVNGAGDAVLIGNRC